MINVGTRIREHRTVVRPESMKVWAAALHDPNPIHLDPTAVQAAGLGDRVINQGPANVGYLVNAIAGTFPGSTLERIDVRFLDNLYGGDVALATGSVTAVREEEGVVRIECDLRLAVEDGVDVLTGTATVALPPVGDKP